MLAQARDKEWREGSYQSSQSSGWGPAQTLLKNAENIELLEHNSLKNISNILENFWEYAKICKRVEMYISVCTKLKGSCETLDYSRS